MKVLGIETSCDETGVAVYDSEKGLLANALYSQISLHKAYGGVVPELASRDHLKKLIPLIEEALSCAGINKGAIEGVAYTKGPGLAGALLVGAVAGRSLAFALNVPAVGVHHIESHLLAVMLEENCPNFPFLSLIVSGGHTLLVAAYQLGSYEILGETLDDAVGEAFDKTAKLLGLGYPGGAALSRLAENGREGVYKFPRPMVNQSGLAFSFSGLKTYASQVIAAANESSFPDIAYAFQKAVVETLLIKCRRAIEQTGLKQLVLAGGVAANQSLRSQLKLLEKTLGIEVFYPRTEFCTDNAAMVAYTGCQYLMKGKQDGLAVKVMPRWPLNEIS